MNVEEPGGYLQWDERLLDMSVAGPSSEKTSAMEALVSEMNQVGDKIGSDFR